MENSFRGPRLGTKLFILMSLSLVVIPLFSYLYLKEMEDFLIDSQANAQLLTAEGISTLLNGRRDLFYELPLTPEGYEQLYAHPLTKPIRIDGRANDWEELLQYTVRFGNKDELSNNRFKLLLGEQNDQIYALLQIEDESLIYRDRDILRLDLSDHLRITFSGLDGQISRLVIAMTEPGVTTAYTMDTEWRYAIEGVAENRVQGHMELTESGYTLEFRMPLQLLGSTRQFGLAVVDVDDTESREIKTITGTLPSAGREAAGLVLLKSPEVLKIVQGLGYSGANIQVVDSQRQVRAEVGSYQFTPETNADSETEAWSNPWFSLMRIILRSINDLINLATTTDEVISDEVVIKDALLGKPSYQRRYTRDEGEVIVAAHPIIAQDEVIGTVVLKQNTNRIQELRRDALERIINFSVLSLFIFVALILAFSVRLARRIRKLGAEATSAIDIYGRLRANQLTSETKSGDEIGDLARSISGMLARLHQHNQFLENMPRTLRHEINNPLNTLSTSLQNLEDETSEVARVKYLESAKRGVTRIGMIVQNLADAASLEDALEADEFEKLDLYELLQNYLANCSNMHSHRKFEYRGTHNAVVSMASDYRIEQLLDKLIDNAVDFSEPDSTITVGLTTEAGRLTLFVTNYGPTIPEDLVESVFDSMVTVRANSPDNRLHFGMGLYVVRVIAEHHGGTVSAANLLNGNGVSIRVTLPLHGAASNTAAAAS